MALKLRPTGLGSGIDKDRPDYSVYTSAAIAEVATSAVRATVVRRIFFIEGTPIWISQVITHDRRPRLLHGGHNARVRSEMVSNQ